MSSNERTMNPISVSQSHKRVIGPGTHSAPGSHSASQSAKEDVLAGTLTVPAAAKKFRAGKNKRKPGGRVLSQKEESLLVGGRGAASAWRSTLDALNLCMMV